MSFFSWGLARTSSISAASLPPLPIAAQRRARPAHTGSAPFRSAIRASAPAAAAGQEPAAPMR